MQSNQVVGLEHKKGSPVSGAERFILKTAGGLVVRVTKETFEQASAAMYQGGAYLKATVDSNPAPDADFVVTAAIIDEDGLRSRVAALKAEAADLAKKLAEVAG